MVLSTGEIAAAGLRAEGPAETGPPYLGHLVPEILAMVWAWSRDVQQVFDQPSPPQNLFSLPVALPRCLSFQLVLER